MIQYITANTSHIQQLKTIWRESFSDTRQGTELFFQEKFPESACYAAKDGETICASLYLIPVRLNGRQAHYLYGAATKPEYRGRGIMKQLIGFALERAKQQGDVFSVLLPANDGLYGFYALLGYRENCCIEQLTVHGETVADAEQTETKLVTGQNYNSGHLNQIVSLREQYLQGNCLEWSKAQLDYALRYSFLYNGAVLLTPYGYASVYDTADGTVPVWELVCKEGYRNVLLSGLKQYRQAQRYEIRLAPKNGADCRRFGMIKFLTDTAIDQVYIGLTKD